MIRERVSGVLCLVVVVALFFRAGAQWRFRGIDARLVTRGVTRVRGVRLALETELERVRENVRENALRELVLEPRRKRDTVQKKRSIRVALGRVRRGGTRGRPRIVASRARRCVLVGVLVGIPERPAFRPRPPSP